MEKISYSKLKALAIEMEIPISKNKDILMEEVLKTLQKYKNTRKAPTKQKPEKYIISQQLGEKGKEGITYQVHNRDGQEYAMKTFKKTKSVKTLVLEAELQQLAAESGIAPQITDVNTDTKYIVMQKLDTHLVSKMEKQQGCMTQGQQKQVINIFKKLDKCKIFHGDINPMNFMYKKSKLYIIDFGMSKHITPQLIKKLGTKTPNLDLMSLAMVIKLKKLGCPESSYNLFLDEIPEEKRELFPI